MMKHLPKLLSVILLLSLLTGCDNSRPATTVPETTMVPTTAAPETTVAPTTAPITTAAPTTEPLNVYCDLPEFTPATDPTTLPADPVLSDLVTTGYTGSACWKDLSGNIEAPSFCLPSVTPFCADAIAINREIAEIFTPILEKARDYFDQKVTAMEAKISYEASLSGDILTILITTDTFYDYHRYHTFAIDIATGQRLDQQALVSRVLNIGYAEFLYRATYTAYNHLSQKGAVFGSVTDGGYTQSYQLYLADDGTPMICTPRPGELYSSIELPYDPAAQGSDLDAAGNEYYRWLFRLQPSSTTEWYAQEFWPTAWGQVLNTLFDHDSVKMLRYLATEDAACIDRAVSCLPKAVPAQQQEAFAARCRELSTQEDPAVAQLARKLLDALEEANSAFVRVTDHIPNIFIDLRYATENNFTGQAIYDFRDAYLRYGTVKKLIAVQNELRTQGLILKIWDTFRPTAAQFRLWEVCPDPNYVADPTKGFSSHSRGNTLDITLCYADGTELKMPTGFDDFSPLADRDYSDCAPEAAANAKLLESIMTKHGFTGYAGEWWHYSDVDNYDVDAQFTPA
jgi:D-alanyl-D-alanine dipeptidase